jgi:hypothetical protein
MNLFSRFFLGPAQPIFLVSLVIRVAFVVLWGVFGHDGS